MNKGYYIVQDGKVTHGPIESFREADALLGPICREVGQREVHWKPVTGIAAVDAEARAYTFVTHNCYVLGSAFDRLKRAVREVLGDGFVCTPSVPLFDYPRKNDGMVLPEARP